MRVIALLLLSRNNERYNSHWSVSPFTTLTWESTFAYICMIQNKGEIAGIKVRMGTFHPFYTSTCMRYQTSNMQAYVKRKTWQIKRKLSPDYFVYFFQFQLTFQLILRVLWKGHCKMYRAVQIFIHSNPIPQTLMSRRRILRQEKVPFQYLEKVNTAYYEILASPKWLILTGLLCTLDNESTGDAGGNKSTATNSASSSNEIELHFYHNMYTSLSSSERRRTFHSVCRLRRRRRILRV